ncbi:hypothetical protein PsdCFBP2356_06370 [Pseudomonas syringae pv. dysoxyli]|uniref:hypothetical protein n=1 Tax=Pseudomonas syringae TaxID=317 RepID=UPI001372D8BD|nr:hypothetical protein [Pseudomonas syringae]NAO26202.1 hypothetical protein [Pseudomonas syringae pv. dysoxyli]
MATKVFFVNELGGILRKDKLPWDESISFDDYKLDHVYTQTMMNFTSVDKWLYLGADAGNDRFAKIGITMGDLGSRSYSSANPNYYLFCAFKCNHDVSRDELIHMENVVLERLDGLFKYDYGASKRMYHYESGVLSECYQNINFQEFFVTLHQEIYDGFRHKFVISEMVTEIGMGYGEFVDCLFSHKITNHQYFRDMIIQY